MRDLPFLLPLDPSFCEGALGKGLIISGEQIDLDNAAFSIKVDGSLFLTADALLVAVVLFAFELDYLRYLRIAHLQCLDHYNLKRLDQM